MQGVKEGFKAVCGDCGFEVTRNTNDKGAALRAFSHFGWKIKDPDGMKEASGDPSGDLCGMCVTKKRFLKQ